MSGEKGRVFTGARARLMIGSEKVGFARNVSVGEEIEYQPVEELDNIEVSEFVAIAYRVTFTASMFRVVGETLKSKGYFPSLGQSSEDHLTNILSSGELSASIEDSKTGNVVATLEQVKVASQNFTVDARGIVGKDVTFNAIRLKDESET